MHDIVIIGAGPAGMTAALYALRAGKTVLLLEGESFGGQISYSPKVENYPSIEKISGSEFSSNLLDQIVGLGADIEFGKAVEIKDGEIKTVCTEGGESFQGKAVIIATGLKHRSLGVDKEGELVGKGISYCAVCDGAFFKGLDVAVVGGGDAALQEALYLANTSRKVYLIHRRDEFRAENRLVEKVRQTENIELVLDSVVAELVAEQSLETVKVENAKEASEREIAVSGLFVAVGQISQNEYFKDLETLDESGYFDTDETTISKTKGIFVAGDCRRKQVRQLTTAVSDGAVAAVAASKYIDEN